MPKVKLLEKWNNFLELSHNCFNNFDLSERNVCIIKITKRLHSHISTFILWFSYFCWSQRTLSLISVSQKEYILFRLSWDRIKNEASFHCWKFVPCIMHLSKCSYYVDTLFNKATKGGRVRYRIHLLEILDKLQLLSIWMN